MFRRGAPKPTLAVAALVALTFGCRIRSTERRSPDPATSAQSGAASGGNAIGAVATAAAPVAGGASSAPSSPIVGVAITGIGTSGDAVPAAVAALTASRLAIDAGRSCLDAVIAGVRVLEDEPTLNAGTGAALRLDGSSELDAAVMTSHGAFGAVAGVSDVKNPSVVARAVADTPHRVLSGAGASRLARALGLEPVDVRTDSAVARYKALVGRLRANEDVERAPEILPWSAGDSGGGAGGAPFWQSYLPPPRRDTPVITPAPPAAVSNPVAPSPAPAAPEPSVAAPPPSALRASPPSPPVSGGDTVGVVFRCGEHDYAGAVSGGGPWLALPGRIGDVPIPGAALYVGDAAAVVVTGPGEKILSRMLAKAVYDKLASGSSVDATLTWAAADFAAEQLVVAILDARGAHVGPGAGSAWAALDPSLRTSNKAD